MSFAPLPEFQNDDPDNTIRIMLATDNHIGYLERHEVRGQDALVTFREILQLAVKHQVDFILLAGDLFHDNRPSRDIVYSVIASLREYTLGDKPVQVELLSDPDDGKATGYSFPAINYEDPNLNIAIPVFSIHGNHDDPQGTGPTGALCALDLLSVTGLINYMGKVDLPAPAESSAEIEGEKDGITIRPVLLQKGHTKLAMYGVGNIKDQRMQYELRAGRVKMFMPSDKDEWFNLLLLHQNRVAHTASTHVPEGLFSDSINLVVWGHEHDCRIIPEPVTGKPYLISQPGSSVATSLTEGEALEKHCALVQINTKSFTLTPIPLLTVRPMVVSSMSLVEASEEDSLDLDDSVAVKRYLSNKVEELITKAMNEWETRRGEALAAGLAISPSKEFIESMTPLIRLKVNITGAPELFNPVRFGAEFTKKVANPKDILVFHRAARRTQQGQKAEKREDGKAPLMPVPEKLERVRVQNLVREYLSAQELVLLSEGGLNDAIAAFVEKDDNHSISSFIGTSLNTLISGVKREGVRRKNTAKGGAPGDPDANDAEEELPISDEESDDLDGMIRDVKEAAEKEYKGGRKTESANGHQPQDDNESLADSMEMDVDIELDLGGARPTAFGSDDDEEALAPKKKSQSKKTATGSTTARATTKATSSAATAKRGKTTSKPAPKGKGKKKSAPSDDSAEDFDLSEIESHDDSPEPVVQKKGRAAVLETIGVSKKPKQPVKRAQPTLSFVPTTVGAAGRTTGRKAAVAARGKTKSAIEIESDSS